jgi:hypothetical protein
MISCGACFLTCSWRCPTNATLYKRVEVWAEASVPLQTWGFLKEECTVALKPGHPCFRHSTVTWYWILYIWTYYMSIACCSCCLPIPAVLFSWTGFVILSSQGLLLISVFVFDILRITRGRSQICSGCSAPTLTPLAMGLICTHTF